MGGKIKLTMRAWARSVHVQVFFFLLLFVCLFLILLGSCSFDGEGGRCLTRSVPNCSSCGKAMILLRQGFSDSMV